MSRPTLYLHNPVVYLQNSDSPRARKRREEARAPADVRICFCSEGEELDDLGDDLGCLSPEEVAARQRALEGAALAARVHRRRKTR